MAAIRGLQDFLTTGATEHARVIRMFFVGADVLGVLLRRKKVVVHAGPGRIQEPRAASGHPPRRGVAVREIGPSGKGRRLQFAGFGSMRHIPSGGRGLIPFAVSRQRASGPARR